MRVFKKRHAPGTAPGTVEVTGPPTEPIRARYVEYGLEGLTETEPDRPDELPEAIREFTQWLDIEGHDTALIKRLGERLSIHPLALEDVINVGQRTKSEDFEDAVGGRQAALHLDVHVRQALDGAPQREHEHEERDEFRRRQ